MASCSPSASARPTSIFWRHYLDALEAREGIEAGATRILTIATESAAAVLALTAAPARHARLIGHSWGGEDLMADLGALAKGPSPGEYDDTFRLARTVNLMASVAAGVTAYDTVYPDIKNVAGLRAEATDARRMGYGGKIAIHPDQVAIIHEVFTPTAQEVDWAKRVVDDVRKQPRLRCADARRQDAGQAAPDPGASASRPDGWMKDNFGLLETLEQLFAGDRQSLLTLDEFLGGLHGRSYAFAIAALNVPNCIPTGIPWLSTITGLPMVFLLVQFFAGREVPKLPALVGRRGLRRGKLQTFLGRARRSIRWLEDAVHVRHEWWVSGMPRRALLLAWAANIVILALPIPFDNLFPAWAIMFFCLALIEDDGVMAMLGWLLSVITAVWTIFLLMIGHAAVMAVVATIKHALLD